MVMMFWSGFAFSLRPAASPFGKPMPMMSRRIIVPGGVITESDKKDAEEMLGDPTAIVTWNTKQKLDQIRSQARKGMEAELSAFGAAPKAKPPSSESDEL